MIEAEIGDPGHRWSFDYVGSVKAAAKANLQDAGVRRRTRKGEQRRGCCDLEEAGFDSRARVKNLVQQPGERIVIDQPSGDSDSLVETDQVRTGERVHGAAA